MSLIEAEQDDEAILRAEDEAILLAAQEQADKPPTPLGPDLAKLIEDLTNGKDV